MSDTVKFIAEAASRYAGEVAAKAEYLDQGGGSVWLGEFAGDAVPLLDIVVLDESVVRFAAQYIPVGGHSWADLLVDECLDEAAALAAIEENIHGWQAANQSQQYSRPVRYRVVRRLVIKSELVVKEVQDDGK